MSMSSRSKGRITTLARHVQPQLQIVGSSASATGENEGTVAFLPSGTLTIRDNRTGKEYEVKIQNGTIQATGLRDIKVSNDDFGLMVYDPGFVNTAVVKSKISYIDGDKGILEYRGYPIEQLAEKCSFLEVAYLLLNGDLPDKHQKVRWEREVLEHTFIHDDLKNLLHSFRYDAHPMGMLISSIAALGTFYPEANPALKGDGLYSQASLRNKQILRIVGKVPTIAACAYRHRIGRPYNSPSASLGYVENFLYMMDHLSQQDFAPNPRLSRALEVLFILHAEHELNCSTAAMRHLASSKVDPYTCIAGACGALYGPLHGGANEAVLHMLEHIGSKDRIPGFIESVKRGDAKLMGFGHRIYKSYDPRAKLVRNIAYEVFDLLGREPLVEVAVELERIALSDEYFKSRKLYPNVDFYSGLIYKAMGFPLDMFPVMFAIPRVVGWLAHWAEHLADPEQKIARPRQVYLGETTRSVSPMLDRPPSSQEMTEVYSSNSGVGKRNAVASWTKPHSIQPK